MIKFFRKIRQHLLTQNKFNKYLLYAIGEIILVVIGILIALQINQWNQERHRKDLEYILLEQLRDELDDLYQGDMVWDLMTLELNERSHFRILDYIADDQSYADSMCFDFYWMTTDDYIYPANAAYARLKENGLDIISNDSIRAATQNLYESLFPRISKSNSYYQDITAFYEDFLYANFRTNDDMELEFFYAGERDTIVAPSTSTINVENGIEKQHTFGYVPLDFEELKRNSEFMLRLKKSLTMVHYKVQRYRRSMKLIDVTNALIDRELAKRQ